MYELSSFEHKGVRVSIGYDEGVNSPREDSGFLLSRMVCFHGRYTLPNEDKLNKNNFTGWQAIENHIRRELGGIVVLPIFMYDHGGIAFQTTPFNDRFDSGQVGFIYITKEKAKEFLGTKELGYEEYDKLNSFLVAEVEAYDMYARGEVKGIELYVGDDVVDSCFGFYMEEDEVRKEGVRMVEEYLRSKEVIANAKHREKKHSKA